jgi:putative spermidine/putrescine transport system ATP-binding protein
MQVGSPEDIYQRPNSRFVADFVGSSNVLPPDFVARHGGQRRWASLRPEAVRIAAADGIAATVISRSYLGGTTRLGLDVEGQRLNALLPAGQPLPAEGQSVRIGFAPADLHLMDDAG